MTRLKITAKLKIIGLVVITLAVALLLMVAQYLGGYALASLKVREWLEADAWHGKAIWLPDYQVVVEAQPIANLKNDLSALTYDPDRNTLFSVTNIPPEIIEFTLEGVILRRITLLDFGDIEAIEYLSRDTYLVADERKHRLITVRITDDTTELTAADSQQLTLGIGLNGNKGFEGLTYDSDNQRIYIAKERDPVRIYEVRGFPYSDPSKPLSIDIQEDRVRDAGLFVRDLSSLQYVASSGHLLALSDESHLLLELDVDGKPISSLSLLAGQHGLKNTIRQAEGVAMDKAGVLYLVSEPNLFYIFKKTATH
jgi:uncharacterized protein YjiK